MKILLETFQRKGVVESIVYGSVKLWEKVFSYIKIIFLVLRGYRIDPSAILKGDNFFFQSKKRAIKIGKNTVIGKHTRISCGGTGEIHIGDNVLIDDYTYIMAHEKISIDDNSKIAAFSFITDFNHNFANSKLALVDQGYSTKRVVIGKNVWIGTHAIVLKGVTIGNNSVIGGGSVVVKDVSPNTVAVGNPAKPI